jgi:hypothetical protein
VKLMLDGTSVIEFPLNWIELPVTDIGLMALLKFTVTPALVPMLVAKFGGATVVIVGLAVSAVVPAVKVGLKAFTGTPSVLVTALLIFTL